MTGRRALGTLLALALMLVSVSPSVAHAGPTNDDSTENAVPLSRTTPDEDPALTSVEHIALAADGAGASRGIHNLLRTTSRQAASSTGSVTSSSVVGSCPYGTPRYGSPTCGMYDYSGIRWRSGTTVWYSINPNFTRSRSRALSVDLATEAVRQSFYTWSRQLGGKVLYRYGGRTSARPGLADGRNVVAWGTLPWGTLAAAQIWYNTRTREMAGFDVTLNDRYAWSYTPPRTASCRLTSYTCEVTNLGLVGTYDVRNVVTHEAGHTLMLDDLRSAGASALTMYAYARPRELKKGNLAYGDFLGLWRAYGLR